MVTIIGWLGSPLSAVPASACTARDGEFSELGRLAAAGRIQSQGNLVYVPLPELERVQTQNWFCSRLDAIPGTAFLEGTFLVRGGNVVAFASEMTYGSMVVANSDWKSATRLLGHTCAEHEAVNDRYSKYRNCGAAGAFASLMRAGTKHSPGVHLWIAVDEATHEALQDAMAAGP